MPPRKKPFSGRKKKEQLKKKRESQRQDEKPVEHFSKHAASDASDLTRSFEVQLSTALGKSGARNQWSTIVAREEEEDVQKRREFATEPLQMELRGQILRAPALADSTELDFPRHALAAESPEEEEHRFQQWLIDIYARYPRSQLNTFEHNLEVWKQLWLVTWQCTALAALADVRQPLFHISRSLYRHVTEELGKPFIIVLSKVDLVSPQYVDAWVETLRALFPATTAIISFTSCGDLELHRETSLARRRRRLQESRQQPDEEHIAARLSGGMRLLEAAGATEQQRDAVFRDVMEQAGLAARAPVSRVGDADDDDRNGGDDDNDSDANSDDSDSDTPAGLIPMGAASSRGRAAKARARREAAEEDKREQPGGARRRGRKAKKPRQTRTEVPQVPGPRIVLGCVGHPNVGKSSLINALAGRKRVSVSRTPGHTKRAQTIPLLSSLSLYDCPGLLFPHAFGPPRHLPRPSDASADEAGDDAASGGGFSSAERSHWDDPLLRKSLVTDRALQECAGLVPLAQVREPYTSVRFLAERLPIERWYGLTKDADEPHWTAFSLCEALAVKRGIIHARSGRPDAHAAGRMILQDVVDGVCPLSLWPAPVDAATRSAEEVAGPDALEQEDSEEEEEEDTDKERGEEDKESAHAPRKKDTGQE